MLIPQVLGGQHLAGLVVQQVPVQVALIVPHGLDAVGLVGHHRLVTGHGEPVNLRDRPPKKASRIVEITLISRNVGLRQGPAFIGEGLAITPVETRMEGPEERCQDLHAHMVAELHVHVQAHQVMDLAEEALLGEVADHLHPVHGYVLPAFVVSDLEDHHLPPFLEGDLGHVRRLVGEDVVVDLVSHHEVLLGRLQEELQEDHVSETNKPPQEREGGC